MDVLDDVFTTLGLRGALYFRTDFSPPWAIQVPDYSNAARFHLVVEGQCHVAQAGAKPVLLGPGDLILIPRGRAHQLADAPDRRGAPLERVLQDAGYAGDGVLVLNQDDPRCSTRMICGHLGFRRAADHPLLRALPEQVVISAAERAREPLLDDILRLIARQLFREQPGSQAAVIRLSEVLFIELLRLVVERSSDLADLLQAFADKHIGRALELIHARPEAQWSLDSLAKQIGMSRTRFAVRFRELTRHSPIAYLAEWRLQKALMLLDQSQIPVQQIASRTGYRSAAAFSRAFAERFGSSPKSFRETSAA